MPITGRRTGLLAGACAVLAAAVTLLSGAPAGAAPAGLRGMDVSGHQGNVNWSSAWANGKTLPGALDIEYNPYGTTCYGLSQAAMRSWVASFLNRYHTRTTRWPTIYTTTDWWTTCTGNYAGFAANDPLWIARYSTTVGTLPAGWGTYSFWQWAAAGTLPGDQDVWNGTLARLTVLACNGTC